jgi:hypothetical protein
VGGKGGGGAGLTPLRGAGSAAPLPCSGAPASDRVEQASTGIPGVEPILGRELRRGALHLVVGEPGTRKTVLAHPIGSHVARGDGSVLYLTPMIEAHASLVVQARTFEFFDPSAVERSFYYASVQQAFEERGGAHVDPRPFEARPGTADEDNPPLEAGNVVRWRILGSRCRRSSTRAGKPAGMEDLGPCVATILHSSGKGLPSGDFAPDRRHLSWKRLRLLIEMGDEWPGGGAHAASGRPPPHRVA